ncbi:ATPase [Trypanosoma cruzi]|nr:ATPase [Trypanosoma cruzi]
MLTTTALCASPAARMRRGGDERRAEGAVTCGRATRACGAEHTFLSSCFLFSLRRGRADTRSATHTATPCRRVLKFFCFSCEFLAPCVIVEAWAVPRVSLPSSCASCCVDVPPCAPPLFSVSPTHTHTSICAVRCRIDLAAALSLLACPVLRCVAAACVPVRRESRCHWMDVCGLASRAEVMTRLHDARHA